MPIYYDRTEIANSPTWKQLFDKVKARPFPRLEKYTGADVAIVPQEIAKRREPLMEAIKTGVLVQRKENTDMLNSIPHLKDILSRMLACESVPVLAVVGEFKSLTGAEQMEVNGRVHGWSYRSFAGALFKWQLRGGLAMQFPHPVDLAEWYSTTCLQVERGDYEKAAILGPKASQAIGGGPLDHKPWRTALMALDGLGPERGYQVAEEFGTLAEALIWLTDPDEADLKIRGIAQGTHEKVRRHLGLKEGQWLTIESLPPTVNGVENPANIVGKKGDE